MSRVSRYGLILIAALAAACGEAPAPPEPPPEPPAATPARAESELPPPEELPVDPVDAALSAAAGLPQELAAPLVEGLALGFEYGTLLDVAADEGGERQVLIEPIGLAVDEAVAQLERGLRAAGFEPVAADAGAPSGAQQFLRRRPDQGPAEVLSLESTPYPDPESAAHPGGTGVIALRLETREGRG